MAISAIDVDIVGHFAGMVLVLVFEDLELAVAVELAEALGKY